MYSIDLKNSPFFALYFLEFKKDEKPWFSMLFEQLVIANINENGSYSRKFADLRDVIIQTKNEFKELLSNDVKRLMCEGGDDF